MKLMHSSLSGKVTDITDSSVKFTYPCWGEIANTVTTQWRPNTFVGKIKTAAVRTIAKKLDWYYPRIYNDVGTFRKSDKTVSRRIKWERCITKPITKSELAKFQAEVKKLTKIQVLEVSIKNAGIYIHMREKV